MAWNGFLKIFKQSPVSDNVGKLKERKKIRIEEVALWGKEWGGAVILQNKCGI